MPFTFTPLKIPDVILIEPKVFRDNRGWFMETYKKTDFQKNGIPAFVQSNYAFSAQKGTLRGLHYQKAPKSQGKLVRCVKGEIFDVAVDIRKGSPTFGKWASANLSEGNKLMLWVPPGFAHGILTLADNVEVLYNTTDEYSPEHEAAIRWNDPDLGIKWPLMNPVLIQRDAEAPLLKDADNNFEWKP